MTKQARTIIYPFQIQSESAVLLTDPLEAIRVYPDRKYRPATDDFIINWGNSHEPNWASEINRVPGVRVLNHWDNVALAINKKKAFPIFKAAGVSSVRFTTSPEVVKDWLEDHHVVFARTKVKSMLGQGIVIMKNPEDLVEAPLYTRFIPNCSEYRIHVANGKVIDRQQKRRMVTGEWANKEPDPFVRAEANGWTFARKDVHMPKVVEEEAIKALRALELDFGGCDVLYSKKDDKAFILEVNTAPGIVENYGLEAYTQAFKERKEAI